MSLRLRAVLAFPQAVKRLGVVSASCLGGRGSVRWHGRPKVLAFVPETVHESPVDSRGGGRREESGGRGVVVQLRAPILLVRCGFDGRVG